MILFLTGLGIGLVVGACLGVVIAGLLLANIHRDDDTAGAP